MANDSVQVRENGPLWRPSAERARTTSMYHFAVDLARAGEVSPFAPDGSLNYEALHAWSVKYPERFWPRVWGFCGVVATERPDKAMPWDTVVHGLDHMAPPNERDGPRWFLGARLNFAENLLRFVDEREAIVSWNEQGRRGALTYSELRRRVARAARALKAMGIAEGDRVAAFMPNIPETIVAMLATASVGAIWSSCSPDFGVGGVLDRFGQIAPRVLIACDGYRYAGKEIDTLGRVADIASQIASIERVVVVPYLHASPNIDGVRDARLWDDWCGADALGAMAYSDLTFAQLPFDHPLYIMYSSGTTGLPKCMVHSAGGTLLQHLKEHVLHGDLTRYDRIFYFTTCGWMMWNWLVSALAVGATVVLYDGAPMARASTAGSLGSGAAGDLLWEMAERERISVFGTSAKYLALAEKEGLRPGMTRDLSTLKCVLSTGSPLAPASFDYVYRDIKRDVRVSSISGGTDIVSCFALGNPAGAVWRGELQVPGLGMAVDVYDDNGTSLRGAPGELVCTRPFPSMPVSFWNDPDGARYRAAYFERFPGVWWHGDWAEFTPHGGLIITGRSDATLNPGGVRIGTAEIYRQVEHFPDVLESLVVGQDVVSGGERDIRIVLFVRLRDGRALDDTLRDAIKRRIREHCSPHHVPKVIVAVRDIPRTISGKITELAVRDVIHGRTVKNVDALANPEALELFRALPELALPPA